MNSGLFEKIYELIKRESCCHIETSLLICPANEYSAYHTVAVVLGILLLEHFIVFDRNNYDVWALQSCFLKICFPEIVYIYQIMFV